MALKILIKYFNIDIPRIEKLEIGGWFDLRNIKEEIIFAKIYNVISLGVAMKLPEGYEAIIAPRSSSFKNWGVLQVNGLGIIDESYSGNNDEWKWAVYPTRDTIIKQYSRICQFRIQKRQPDIIFTEVSTLEFPNRNGFGSTGYT